MNDRIVFSLLITMSFCQIAMTQPSIGINTSTPHPSAVLDVQSTNKGILAPRLTTAQRTSISDPAAGLMVYDTDTQSFWYYHGVSGWINILNAVNGWCSTGNTATNGDFLGTTNYASLTFKANNIQAGKIDLDGQNTLFGLLAGVSNTSGTENTAIGKSALASNLTGSGNVAIGVDALTSNTVGSNNTSLGKSAMSGNIDGVNNTASGIQSMQTNQSGSYNAAYGAISLYNNSTGNNNTAIGDGALYQNTTGHRNVSIGSGALYSNKANSRTTAVGYQAMRNADDRTIEIETYNTAVGYEALKGSATPAANTGISNTAIGDNSLFVNTSGSSNTAVGRQSLLNNEVGSENVAIGALALYHNRGRGRSTAVGYRAMHFAHNTVNPAETFNTALGYKALEGSTNPNSNTGTKNTGAGDSALKNITGGSMNTAVGESALLNTTIGNMNVGIGNGALQTNVNGSGNVAIGHQADVLNNNLSNAIAIGNGAKVNASNCLILGNGDIRVGIGTSEATAHMDISAANVETKLHVINTGVHSAGIEVRAKPGGGSTYIDFTCQSINNNGGGNPDYTYRIHATNTHFLLPNFAYSRNSDNVGIGTSNPVQAALLELSSTSKGFRLPNMTKAQRNAIQSPVAGLMIYQNDNIPGLRVYNGTNWMRFVEISD